MSITQFSQTTLHNSILRSLDEEGYRTPTPIQSEAIPRILAGEDLLATAQTGTGKTAAFALPILHLLNERAPRGSGYTRALILTPTRELALQIDASFRAYGRHLRLRTAVILGGVPSGTQIRALKQNPDIIVATPGRLIDLRAQGYVHLEKIEMLVLDEADRMLDMGFIVDVRRIAFATPATRQSLLFSATLSPEIAELASDMLRNPSYVEVAPSSTVAQNIEQKVLFVEQGDKRDLLTDILRGKNVSRALVFARTKHRADRISRQLSDQGISADAIHSNKSQGARQRALSAFDRGRIKVLVGTDIVARGIDVEGISHVINYEMPEDPENYIHRIGRTARAGAAGIALSFCDADELELLRSIEKLTKTPLTVEKDQPFHSHAIAEMCERKAAQRNPAPKSRFLRKNTPKKPFGRQAGR